MSTDWVIVRKASRKTYWQNTKMGRVAFVAGASSIFLGLALTLRPILSF